MRLVAAKPRTARRPSMAPLSGVWRKPGGGGDTAPAEPVGANSQIHALGDGAEWIRFRPRRSSRIKEPSCAISITSASIWEQPPRCVDPTSRTVAANPAEATQARCRAQGDRGWSRIWSPKAQPKRKRRCAMSPLSDQSTGLPGLSPGTGTGPADRLRHDRKRSPSCAPGPSQKSRIACATTR